LGLACLAVYANTLTNGFVGDDEPDVLNNPWIKDWRLLPEIFSRGDWRLAGTTSISNYYRPLRNVLYLATYNLFGLNAWGFHLVSILFHAANTFLVFLLATRLTDAVTVPDSGFPAGKVPTRLLPTVPIMAGLLFATHPIHSEAVAWVASLPELSFTFFFLLALHSYAGMKSCFGKLHWLSVAAFFMALLCKEPAITLLFLLPACDLAFNSKRRTLRDYFAVYSPFGLATIVYLFLRYRALSSATVTYAQSYGLNGLQLMLNVLPLFVKYLGKLALPLQPDFLNPYTPVDSLLTPRFLLCIPVTAGFLYLLFRTYRKNRNVFLALLIIAIPLVPALYIRALSGMLFAERYLYLPSVGFVIAVACLLQTQFKNRPGILWLLLVPVVTLYSISTVGRNTVWHDTTTLLSYSLRNYPGNTEIRYELATRLYNNGRVDEAILQYRILIRSNPRDARFHSALGGALIRKDQLDEAIEHLNTAVALDPRSLESLNDLAVALRRKGKTEEAILIYQKALAVNPDYPEAHFNLGTLLADSGRGKEAVEHLAASVRGNPESAYYRNLLGIEYAKQGQIDRAVEQLEAAVRLAPDEPSYRRNLERALRMRSEAPATTDRQR
jgi:Flp pilus assembly protein TadD